MHAIKNGILMAVLAHSFIGASLIWDKVLLRNPQTKNLPAYVFWLGAISIFGLALLPFGFHVPAPNLCAIAFLAGVLNLVASWFYYYALNAGEASETLAIMGGFSPVATALIAVPLLKQPLGRSPVAFSLMVAGGFVMFLSENLNVRRVLPSVLTGSVTFGLVNVLEKIVYDQTNFVSGYVVFTLGTVAGALAMLLRPSWRRQIFTTSENAPPRSRFWYFINRFVNGLGSFLVYYAISLAAPALVDAITGLRYVIIFIGAWLLTRWHPDWLKEEFSGRVLLAKAGGTALVIAGLVLLSITEGGAASSG
ncbi:MAG TPA: EamA family transporter [Bryobacteraceae bacterium]|nr:EamA family transporter [Bryobacteraceae bacterium]